VLTSIGSFSATLTRSGSAPGCGVATGDRLRLGVWLALGVSVARRVGGTPPVARIVRAFSLVIRRLPQMVLPEMPDAKTETPSGRLASAEQS
jgi:hypothetical protein